jgi:hypothetical protein
MSPDDLTRAEDTVSPNFRPFKRPPVAVCADNGIRCAAPSVLFLCLLPLNITSRRRSLVQCKDAMVIQIVRTAATRKIVQVCFIYFQNCYHFAFFVLECRTQFSCPASLSSPADSSLLCLRGTQICNNVKDCPDNSDETKYCRTFACVLMLHLNWCIC